jgi:hypothetical protein
LVPDLVLYPATDVFELVVERVLYLGVKLARLIDLAIGLFRELVMELTLQYPAEFVFETLGSHGRLLTRFPGVSPGYVLANAVH